MLTRLQLYCEKQGSEQKSTDESLDVEMEEIVVKTKQQIKPYKSYSNEQKMLFVYYNRVKLFNTTKSGGLSGVNLYNDNPQARVVDAVTSLTEKFAGLTIKETSVRNFLKTECNLSFKKKITRHSAPQNDSTKIAKCIAWVEERSKTDMNCLENCIFVDESGFDINMRPPGGWSAKGTPAIVTTPSNRAESHTILGVVSAKYVASMELRNPQEHPFKKSKD
ncbi:hypothetical protein CU098_005278 [Rhizopus stolonifer]|uniref:Uncharacterized protein n=1 Tax=Rhizopus stolonifer TaxID=4846 RepID=A0A367J7T1_RHIST|nr:hypothetical protein CU098_005278 [Rhizopus stolonifer]